MSNSENKKPQDIEIIIEEENPSETEKKQTRKCRSCKKHLSLDLFVALPHIKKTKKSEFLSCVDCRANINEAMKTVTEKNRALSACECGFVCKLSQRYKHLDTQNHIIRMAFKRCNFDPEDPISKLLENNTTSTFRLN